MSEAKTNEAIAIRRAEDRGRTKLDWLDSRHTFSFGAYQDPRHMGYGPLRVINDDRVAPGGGFGEHGHRDMEILTWVLDGALAHRDSLGHGSTIRPGDVQTMSAGTGIRHSEFNASDTDPVHFLQIWILPREGRLSPRYEQKHFDEAQRRNRWTLIAGPDGRDGSTTIQQDAAVWAALLAAGASLERHLDAGRMAWLHVARGRAAVNGQDLKEGDGAAVPSGGAIRVEASADGTEMMLFDLPAEGEAQR